MPSRDWLRRLKALTALAMTGGIFPRAAVTATLALAVGLLLHHGEPNGDRVAVLRHAASQIGKAKEVRGAATTEVESAKDRARVAERNANAAVSRAAAARAQVRVVSVDGVMGSATPNAAVMSFPVPAPVIERMQLDSTAIAALGMLVRWKDTVIVAQDHRITADSLELVATSDAFKELQRIREPHCGRKCGIVLGISGMLAAAVAVEQVRRTLRVGGR